MSSRPRRGVPEPVGAAVSERVRSERPRSERGSATVYAVWILTLLGVLTVAGAQVAGAVVAHRHADAAADLAALAGARALQRGQPACAAATSLAGRNDAEVTACTRHDADVTVETSVDAVHLFGLSWQVTGRARAGPTRETAGAEGPRLSPAA